MCYNYFLKSARLGFPRVNEFFADFSVNSQTIVMKFDNFTTIALLIEASLL